MDLPTEKVDRDATSPFLLKLFYRTGTFHRLEEFASPQDLPQHVTIHTWLTATLTELTHLLADVSPSVLPSPAIGTRIAYRLLYHDTRGNPSAPRLATQDLGSVVIGNGGPGITNYDHNGNGNDGADNDDNAVAESIVDEALLPNDEYKGGGVARSLMENEAEAGRTLADVRFVVGDFLSVAILPPSTVDGSVQPASVTRMGRGHGGPGQARAGRGEFGGPGGFGMGSGRDNNNNNNNNRYGRPLGGPTGGDNRRHRGDNTAPPVGEWRRGERLPDVPPTRGRGRRRW